MMHNISTTTITTTTIDDGVFGTLSSSPFVVVQSFLRFFFRPIDETRVGFRVQAEIEDPRGERGGGNDRPGVASIVAGYLASEGLDAALGSPHGRPDLEPVSAAVMKYGASQLSLTRFCPSFGGVSPNKTPFLPVCVP